MFDADVTLPEYHVPLPEALCIVTDEGKYLRIDTFVEDPDPESAWFQDSDGPRPKIVTMADNTCYLRSDVSLISKS